MQPLQRDLKTMRRSAQWNYMYATAVDPWCSCPTAICRLALQYARSTTFQCNLKQEWRKTMAQRTKQSLNLKHFEPPQIQLKSIEDASEDIRSQGHTRRPNKVPHIAFEAHFARTKQKHGKTWNVTACVIPIALNVALTQQFDCLTSKLSSLL